MALIRTFLPGKQSVRAHTTEVDCFVQVLNGPSGEVRIHLSTFGSDGRASEPKSSQSIQLDEARAVELIAELRKAFPGI